jgi:cell division protein FtsL
MIMLDPRVDALAIDSVTGEALAVDAVEAVVVDVEPVDALLVDLEPEVDPETGRHLRVAPDSVKRRRHVRIAATAAVVSISATLFAVVGFNVELAQHQIQLQKLQTQLQAEQTKYYDLRSQVAQRSSPSVISHKAAQLGLVKTSQTYLSVPIKAPPVDSTGTLNLPEPQTGSSLDPVQ